MLLSGRHLPSVGKVPGSIPIHTKIKIKIIPSTHMACKHCTEKNHLHTHTHTRTTNSVTPLIQNGQTRLIHRGRAEHSLGHSAGSGRERRAVLGGGILCRVLEHSTTMRTGESPMALRVH